MESLALAAGGDFSKNGVKFLDHGVTGVGCLPANPA